ncbi:phenylacetate--CoA ligase family protein [Christiangramia sabulilitoris]|uniref:Phenylacetate--CoA ligase family protein n=1 Tax=Christiangramia sabulilitoris TaxID=2583991 RepID=A0A550I0C2_9FLAO|nr:phenylacetate--CoA ligase family protein [Christiangramia sabulilitoris]TRO64268.1 phenylacetate--CoA ligase family protein [Christiangramia sabulilitoris]
MKDKIYNSLPAEFQNLACSLQGLKLKRERMGGLFQNFLQAYLERKDWSYEQLIDYRDNRLREFVKHAYETVPYYNDLFKNLRLTPSDINSIEDLKSIPVLTKEEVRKNPEMFLSSKADPRKLIKLTTSGSTGTSLNIFYTKEQLQEQFALWWKYRAQLGISLDTWCADFGSRTIVPQKQISPPFWRISYPLKQVKFSAFHGNENNYFEYYKEIKKRNLTWIHGYPTVITPFAAFLLDNNLSLADQIKFVTTGGENLYDFQKEQMFQAFGVYPYSHYGLAECVANFSEDIDHKLTVDEDFSAVEFIPDGGDTYKIIGTNFSNYAMPLLRYDTNDIAVITKRSNSVTKREIDHIDGRSGEIIYLPSGKKVGALSALFSQTSFIVEAQILQKKDYSLEIRYVSFENPKSVESDLNLVTKLLKSRLGDEISFNFKKLDRIPRTSRGKLRYVISELENNQEIKSGGIVKND